MIYEMNEKLVFMTHKVNFLIAQLSEILIFKTILTSLQEF
jgi:hypothetical protein